MREPHTAGSAKRDHRRMPSLRPCTLPRPFCHLALPAGVHRAVGGMGLRLPAAMSADMGNMNGRSAFDQWLGVPRAIARIGKDNIAMQAEKAHERDAKHSRGSA